MYLRYRSRHWFAGGGERGHSPVYHLVFFFQTLDRLNLDETVVLQRLTRTHHLFNTWRKCANPSTTCGSKNLNVYTTYKHKRISASFGCVQLYIYCIK